MRGAERVTTKARAALPAQARTPVRYMLVDPAAQRPQRFKGDTRDKEKRPRVAENSQLPGRLAGGCRSRVRTSVGLPTVLQPVPPHPVERVLVWEHGQGRHGRPHMLCPLCWLEKIDPAPDPPGGPGPVERLGHA